ncbi:hypothetical protein [Sphingobium cupriresistens]|uniref:Uncharacterized protein n=1 Tax=Sphingobium cupriresistens TaxID=1132417 RepID=A0A8G1ZFP8_9SPHN|nr:hypothetical protein [Sphingobium cupriresistens]RYM10511.1 hypothetical protein EWH12_11685 [Sphingobium cupriresistens]
MRRSAAPDRRAAARPKVRAAASALAGLTPGSREVVVKYYTLFYDDTGPLRGGLGCGNPTFSGSAPAVTVPPSLTTWSGSL